MNTRRYPRTLNDAFGPYADRTPIEPMRDDRPMDRADKIVVTGALIAASVLAVLVLMGAV